MKGPPILLLGLAAVAAGCTTANPAPGAGWSRAPDLSVYSAMIQVGGVAREQSMLCGGFRPSTVERYWREDFGGREQAVVSQLIARHGVEAVERAEADAAPTRGVECPDVPTLRWRHHYSRLLRLLEMRLGLA